MDVMQAIKERRSVRKYKPDSLSDEIINDVLEAARWAPSWNNTQCWRFIVVRDPDIQQKLAQTIRPDTNRGITAVKEAPVTIVACAELGKAGFYKDVEPTDKGDWFMFDVALAMQNLALRAYSLGLGTVHIGLFDALEAAKILGVPQGYAVVEMIPIGQFNEIPKTPRRRELNELVFYERFGQSQRMT